MSRCTPRKHVQERGNTFCDCGAVMVGKTAGGNAFVVTVMDAVQLAALSAWGRTDKAVEPDGNAA